MKSFTGCWTCRLRRKKCDEHHPECHNCARLRITCHYEKDKPEWMDGGTRQEEMVQQVKHEIREKAPYRLPLDERASCGPGDRPLQSHPPVRTQVALPREPSNPLATPVSDLFTDSASPESPYMGDGMDIDRTTENSALWRHQDPDDLHPVTDDEGVASGWPDACLLTFYLENFLPFLFPYYRPTPLEGGRSWILDMMMSSPVVRQTALCQSSYFFSLALGTIDCSVSWDRVLKQTKDAFSMLRTSLQDIDGRGIAGHEREAVRVLASIMQMQRFDIAVSSFENCHAHLSAACTLLIQILESNNSLGDGPRSSLDTVLSRLGPSSWILPSQCVQVPSAEQAALRFSAALIILDDIIASTTLQEQPKLYQYHRDLLDFKDGDDAPINMEAVMGCQNWALLQIGEIAALDAWKQQCRTSGNLDVMELVQRATVIKDALRTQLARLEAHPASVSVSRHSVVLDLLSPHGQPSKSLAHQNSLVTRVWAHAALVYLSVVVSGWQPASTEVRYHVGAIINILTQQFMPALLRTMVWPFCVAGCLAEPGREDCLREMVKALQPPSVFGTTRKALSIMEDAWRNRHSGDNTSRDLATCLRSQGDLVLLV